MLSRKQNMQSRKIRLCELWVGESLQNQFRSRKLAKVFLHRMQRAKAKTQAAKVLRKALAKEEPTRKGPPGVQQLFTFERTHFHDSSFFHSNFLKAFATSVSHLP
ncbi:unnamed protein product [Durusdinium trenchii]|uniref:Uncharacterized protein n=1 Tax=Durusdinium trenchii TaxID=1381693 RepID=A0ABP0RYF2_9DINO